MLDVLVNERGRYVKHNRLQGPSSGSPYAFFAILRVGRWMNVRQGACEAQGCVQKRKRLLFLTGGNFVSMGHPRRKPKLLPNKIVLIREYLGIALADMARKLEVSSGRLSNYENGRSEPTLMEMLVYARLGEVHLESIVDDTVSVESCRALLGKQNRRTSGRTYHAH